MSDILKQRITERLEALGETPRSLSMRATGTPDALRYILSGRVSSPRSDTLDKIAIALGTTTGWLLGRDANQPALTKPPIMAQIMASPNDVPVMGTAAGSLLSGSFQFYGGAVDYVRRPPALAEARDVYAIFIEGNSMVPEHRPGDLRFVNPHRPPRIGDSVIVQEQLHENEPLTASIGHLVKVTADHIRIGKLNPEATMDISKKTLVAMHKVLTLNDLFGV